MFETKRLLRRAFCAACFFATSATFASACEVTDWRFGGNRGMRVRSGEACDIAFGTGEGINRSGGMNRLVSTTVVSRPQHGRAGAAGTSSVAYLAAPGYVGQDRFRVEIVSDFNGRLHSYFVNVAVDVYR